MSQGAIKGPSSRKIHPFFTREAQAQSSSHPLPNQARRGDESESTAKTSFLGTTDDDDDDDDGGRELDCRSSRSPAERKVEALPPTMVKSGLCPSRGQSQPALASVSRLTQVPGVAQEQTAISTGKSQTQVQTSDDALTSPNIRHSNGKETSAESNGDEKTSDEKTPSPRGIKVLRFNAKTGTLGSPPKAKRKPTPSLMVCVRFGNDDKSRSEMGEKITQILKGRLKLPQSPEKQHPVCKPPASLANDSSRVSFIPKTTHPFFTSKAKPSPSTPNQTSDSAGKSPAKRNVVSMSTPVSPRTTRNPFSAKSSSKMPQLGNKPLGTRIPGSQHPLWPPQGMTHVRGVIDDAMLDLEIAEHGSLPWRKSKGHTTTVGRSESCMTAMLDRVDVEAVRSSLPRDEDTFAPAPCELRIPKRHFESGRSLQHRVRPQLTITSPMSLAGQEDEGQDELAGPPTPVAHPAVSHHYASLSERLSSFDRSTCENMAWNQKYAPTSASQVLQKGKEAFYIRQWMEAMKVKSVETGNNSKNIGAGEVGKSRGGTIPKKKRKKTDDFIIATDDDDDDDDSGFEEMSGTEEAEAGSIGQRQKSIIRTGDVGSTHPGQLRNTIVISGPHGCGKTAAVYAIAKELDFEIFEINSSGRRSGKDVTEKVGDMTRNHLVQQHKAQQPPLAGGEDGHLPARGPTNPGKQGTMTAFFKARPGTQGRDKKRQAKGDSQVKKATTTAKPQKQSLILVEEADVLYEEDRQFWATLIGMMGQSRRPFVIMCNDEKLLPLQSLDLHGIFRFSPAPMPLAVDVCVLIAANEGHVLRRSAVESLYRSRKHDLRATISDLNFWCQIGVGDRRGGFDWFYSRWPRGSDLDERGDVVRVISENTYERGMGWLGRDAISSEGDACDRALEAMQQTWDFWEADMADGCQATELRRLGREMGSAGQRLMALEAVDSFHQAQSDADVCSRGAFDTQLQTPLDPTQPNVAAAARDDYIVGRTLLDADELRGGTGYGGKTMSLALKSRAWGQLMARSTTSVEQVRGGRDQWPITEETVICRIDASLAKNARDMSRSDIASAFDAIAAAPKAQPSGHLERSIFDGTTETIVLDVAPWVRGIVAFEDELMQERVKLSRLLSEGGGGGGGGGSKKRMRTTRSAYSALEGGERKSTRRERYFGDCLSTSLVMCTGGEAWQGAVKSHASSREARGATEQQQMAR